MPGLVLGGTFYEEVVAPLLAEHFPGLVYDAALIGPGSEVLGLDTAMSMDHNWLPYLRLFLSAEDEERVGGAIHDMLASHLPLTWRGFSLNWSEGEGATRLQEFVEGGPVRHRVYVAYLADWVLLQTGWTMAQPPAVLDWLLIPEQRLLALTGGRIYHNGLGDVLSMQRALAYYPRDIWLYLLHAQWTRIGQEEPFVGRTGIVGDEAGSAVIAARLVRDLMRLCFLIERRYAPYPKHFGAAFAGLECAAALIPIFRAVLGAADWREREVHIVEAYRHIARLFNGLGLTAPVDTDVTLFHDRPFRVIQGESIAGILWEALEDSVVKRLPRGVGKVDQYVDSTDILSHARRCRAFAELYA